MRHLLPCLVVLVMTGSIHSALQVDVPADLIPAGCVEGLEARLKVRGQSQDWLPSAFTGPVGQPRAYQLVFDYDEELAGSELEGLELHLGPEIQRWIPSALEAAYPMGPAFPVMGAFHAFRPCGGVDAKPDLFIELDPGQQSAWVRVRQREAGPMRLELLDLKGRPLRLLRSGFQKPGEYCHRITTRQQGAGLFLIRLERAGRIWMVKLPLMP